MKKLMVALVFLLPIMACYKMKPTEVEMQIPTPAATDTPVVSVSPTATIGTPEPTATSTPVLEYTIEDIKGTGLIIPSGSTIPESAGEGETVEPGDELITKDDSEMTIALNDNTMAHISADSQVTVTNLTPNDTGGFSSKMELLLGNILSEVEKLDESKSSFEIDAGGVVCSVRGTAFEVQKQGANVSTSTFHGVVEMQKNGNIQRVNANEHSTFSFKKSGFLPKRRLNAAEKRHYQTWVKTKARVQKKREARIGRHGAAPVRHVAEEKKEAHLNAQREASVKTAGKARHMEKHNPARAAQRPKAQKEIKKQAQTKAKPAEKKARVQSHPVKPKPVMKPAQHPPQRKPAPKKPKKIANHPRKKPQL